MKKNAVNILATTALSLIVLSIVALFFDATHLFIGTVFQTLGANIVVHLGLIFLHGLEVKHFRVEVLLDNSFIIAVLISFGTIFDWFTSTPIWVLVIMAVIIYCASLFLNLFRMQQDAKEINELLQQRNRKKDDEEEHVEGKYI